MRSTFEHAIWNSICQKLPYIFKTEARIPFYLDDRMNYILRISLGSPGIIRFASLAADGSMSNIWMIQQ